MTEQIGKSISDDDAVRLSTPKNVEFDNKKANAELEFTNRKRCVLFIVVAIIVLTALIIYKNLFCLIQNSSNLANEWHIVAILALSASTLLLMALRAVSDKNDLPNDLMSEKAREQMKQFAETYKNIKDIFSN